MDYVTLLKDQKSELLDALKGKNIIVRDAETKFDEKLKSRLIKIVSGIRRSGKSVFIYNVLKSKNFAYANFDDDRMINANPEDILYSFHEIYGKDLKIIFLDEIQNLKNWELFVNRLYRLGFNLFLTGSNSRLLSKELATHLTGRHIEMEIFPFSFKEFLVTKKFNDDILTTKGKSILKNFFNEYISFGGFPEVIIDQENSNIYIRELVRKIIERDIISRYDVAYKKTFKEIAMALLSYPARKISYNKIKNQFSLKSEHTIKNYVSYLEEAYLLFLVNRFSFKPVDIEKSEKKVYAIDSSIISSISIKHNEDVGHLYENIVALELLRKKSFNYDIDFFYWKNVLQEEVDFIIKLGNRVNELIQVCYDISEPDVKQREVKSLLKACKEVRCNNLTIICNEEKTEIINGKKIKFIPIWKWLLE